MLTKSLRVVGRRRLRCQGRLGEGKEHCLAEVGRLNRELSISPSTVMAMTTRREWVTEVELIRRRVGMLSEVKVIVRC